MRFLKPPAESAGGWKRGDISLPVIQFVPTEYQTQGHHTSDNRAARFSAQRYSGEGRQCSQDLVTVEIERLV